MITSADKEAYFNLDGSLLILWLSLPWGYTIDKCNFKARVYRIGGKVYTEYSEEFKKAFEYEILLQRLAGTTYHEKMQWN